MRLKNFIFNRWPLFLFIGLSFILPAIWLRERLVFAYAEAGFTHFLINPFKLLHITSYIWWDIFGLGVDNARALPLVSYSLLTSGLQSLGFSAIARQYLIFSAVLLISALSMYFLVIELIHNGEKKPKMIAIVAALFYILNPFTMNYIWHRFTSSMFGLPLMPLIFLLTAKLLKKPSLKYAFLFGVTVLFFSVNAINPAYFIPVFLPAALYAVFEIVRTKQSRQWKYGGLGVFLVIGLNFWWMLPLISNVQVEATRVNVLDSLGTLTTVSQWTPLLFILRLIDTATIHWYGVNYHPGWIEFLIPILAIIAILGSRRNKNIIFFGLLLCIGLFLSKGLQPPGEIIFTLMFSHIPFFEAFRNPIEKFGLIIVFSYSFLVPFGIYYIWQLIKIKALRFGGTAIILALLFGVSVWPMWTGDVFSFWQGAIPKGVESVPNVKVKIPDYWREAANYINQDKVQNRILFLPQSSFDGMWYEWEYGYAGADFGSVNLLFDKPIISQLSGNSYAEAYRKMVFDTVFLREPAQVSRLLGLMNARYVLVRNDVNESAMVTVPLTRIHQLLNSVKIIKGTQSFGKLDLYKISDEYFLPHIYASP